MEPPAGAAIGERLRVDGFDCSQPDEQLNPKKKVFEAVSLSLVIYCQLVWAVSGTEWRAAQPQEEGV